MMSTWTLQPGYPVVTLGKRKNGTAILSQQRFLAVQKAKSADRSSATTS